MRNGGAAQRIRKRRRVYMGRCPKVACKSLVTSHQSLEPPNPGYSSLLSNFSWKGRAKKRRMDIHSAFLDINFAALYDFMRRTIPDEPDEPVEPVEPLATSHQSPVPSHYLAIPSEFPGNDPPPSLSQGYWPSGGPLHRTYPPR